MRATIKKIIFAIRAIAYPRRCAGCGDQTEEATDALLCGRCAAQMPHRAFATCPTCKRRVVFGIRGAPHEHARCLRKAPYILVSPGWYGMPMIRNAIHEYKYGGIRKLAEPLGNMLAESIITAAIPHIKTYTVVPVPLHPKKQRSRGFNQAEEIGRVLARNLDLSMSDDALVRTRHTRPQAKLESWEERSENISKAFSVLNTESVSGKRVLLIDDITTSGATLGEAARALRAGGAKAVIAATIARS